MSIPRYLLFGRMITFLDIRFMLRFVSCSYGVKGFFTEQKFKSSIE